MSEQNSVTENLQTGEVDDNLPVTVIVPPAGWMALDFADLWRYRELLLLLTWRNISARYRQSVVGYGWAIIRPVLSMLIFTFVFSQIAGISTSPPQNLAVDENLLAELKADDEIAARLYVFLQADAINASPRTKSYDNGSARRNWDTLFHSVFPNQATPPATIESAQSMFQPAIDRLISKNIIASANWTNEQIAEEKTIPRLTITPYRPPSQKEIPYALFAFTGLLPWMYFSGALNAATTSVVTGGALLKKVYFPKLILPIVAVLAGLVDLAIQLVVLVVLIFWYQIDVGIHLLFAPVFILAAAVTSLAIGLWLTALNVKYRDVGQAIPFIVQTWMWLSPVVYPSSKVPAQLQGLYALNPMVGVIEGFRWSIVGEAPPDWSSVAISFTVVLFLLVSGMYYFRRTETTFADII
ncbi:MAG: ABC transporter permease [Planctomycetaceae bacterium]|nr:ABC transporter permease [Planctomycetaceae bacterium]MCB9952024.1 ABC transporter permease [Planctomycetaceae bacterium]